jgi:hypothetical protein
MSDDTWNTERTAFWRDMAHQLSRNVNCLYEQIEAYYTDKPPDAGPGSLMTVRGQLNLVRGYLDADESTIGLLRLQLWPFGMLSMQVSTQ